MKVSSFLVAAVVCILPAASMAQYLGQYSANPYAGPKYVAPPAPQMQMNPPQLYTPQGQYRGNLSPNQFDPNSVNNPYGQYGNKFSPDSINNPFGAGSKYRNDSPNNPYGQGLGVYGTQ